MAVWIGYLHKSGAPALKIVISGAYQLQSQEFEAIIDTGFSGFVSMPILRAFPLGLILSGTTKVVLADGSVGNKLAAIGSVTIEGEMKSGVILLEPSSNEVLLGMDFLRTFSKTLFVHEKNKLISLIDDSDVEQVMAQIAKAAQEHLAQVKAQAQIAEGQSAGEEAAALADAPKPDEGQS